MRAAATRIATPIGRAVATTPIAGKTVYAAVNPCWTNGAERMTAAAAATASATRTIRTRMLPLLRRRLPLPRPALPLARHLGARFPRLGQPDGDGLLATRDLPARPSALQRAALALAHRAFDLLARLPSVLGHDSSS